MTKTEVVSAILLIVFLTILILFISYRTFSLFFERDTETRKIKLTFSLPLENGFTKKQIVIWFFLGLAFGICQELSSEKNGFFFGLLVLVLSFFSLVKYSAGGTSQEERERNGRIGSIICSIISLGASLAILVMTIFTSSAEQGDIGSWFMELFFFLNSPIK